MGSSPSKVALTTFEIINEMYTAIGSGIIGIIILTSHGIRNNRVAGTFFISSLTIACMLYVFNSQEMSIPDRTKVVIITGCDSGLGYSLALHTRELGFTVLAGCYDLASEGAMNLAYYDEEKIKIFQLDITDNESVNDAVRYARKMLADHRDYVIWGIVNNAGVMIFGEFEWQTEKLMQQQLGVNVMGTMRFTKAFCPLLRHYKGRVINVTSHCAKTSLPGLSVYGASKAAIQGFNDALRVEMRKYGVHVVSILPGSFTTQSNIMAKHMDHVYEMRSAFTKEQEDFYGPYFIKYNSYLSGLAVPNRPRKIDEPEIYDMYERAILSKTPDANYIVEPIRYSIYHTIFKYSPTRIRDYFVTMFMQMPDYEPNEENKSRSIASW